MRDQARDEGGGGATSSRATACRDIVIANAGVSHGTLTEHDEDVDVFREILDVNVMGMVNTFQPVRRADARARQRRAGGHRLGGGLARPAGRLRVQRLQGGGDPPISRRCASSCARSGVQVTTMCPGYIATPMTARNPYRMPFMLQADDAARRFARAIDAGRGFAVIPWPMAIVGRILRALPNAVYDRLAARAGRKPRKG